VKVIELRQNLGKTKAAIRGVDEAAHPAILFCDADLVNLRKEHLDQLIHRYCEGWDMVIMDKGSQPWVFRSLLQSVPAISGTRIFDREHFYKIPFRKTDRFQFENRINDYFLDNGLTIAVSPAKEIHDTRKFIKYPFWKGLFLDLRGGLDVLLANGLLGIFRNLRTFRRIRRLAYTSDETKVPRR
jgi:glycosyltransferase involved in cell wall biosynthesis